MKIIDLVSRFRNGKAVDDLFADESLNPDSEQIIIYLKGDLDIDSEIRFFDIEDTNDDLEITKDEEKYIALFSLDQTAEIIQDYIKQTDKTDDQIARELLQYRLNDA